MEGCNYFPGNVNFYTTLKYYTKISINYIQHSTMIKKLQKEQNKPLANLRTAMQYEKCSLNRESFKTDSITFIVWQINVRRIYKSSADSFQLHNYPSRINLNQWSFTTVNPH